MYQAERWLNGGQYDAPMYVHEETGEHIFAGDMIALKDDRFGKIIQFFTVPIVSSYNRKVYISLTL